jgi:hypothetical protein
MLFRARQLQAGFSVVGEIDGQAIFAQPLGQKAGGLLFVFDQQHAHPAEI